jgi:tripartite-type tricarboxylate transporter receptor subunit TctC
MEMLRRRLSYGVAATAAAALLGFGHGAAPAQANDYPSKPVRLLIGFPPGQATDVLGRAIGQRLQEAFGQSFIVDNKPGASGSIATQLALQAPADGYTLLVSSSGVMAVNPWLYTKLSYDPLKDLIPVAGLGIVPLVLLTNTSFAPANVKQLVAAAKAKPGAINYASSGVGITNHLVMSMFTSAAGIDMTHVPYKGGPPALNDLVAGQVQVMFETSVAALPFVKQGRLRALAVSSAERIDAAPDIPTVAEQGYPGFSGVPWVMLVAPAGTPSAIVSKLNAASNRILQTSEMRQFMAQQGVLPMVMNQSELATFVRTESEKWGKAVKDTGAKAE